MQYQKPALFIITVFNKTSTDKTYIVEDDVTAIPVYRGHAPGQEAALDDQVGGEGAPERVE